MHLSPIGRWIFIAALGLFATPVAAAVPIDPETAVGDIMQFFEASQISDTILEAAKSLFWSLALISLVWTMGMLIVRQDIGELLMELLRFIIVTGLFYWVLINASSRQGGEGFVEDIVMSFLGMVNDQTSDESFRENANDILRRCLHVFFIVINETADGQDADRMIVGAIVVMIVCIGAVMTAQFLIALVMAWILGYAGIFLLGFGGARWTSPIAINYYKHVIAVGIAMLALSLIGAITVSFINELGLTPNGRLYSKFDYLGLMLAVMILMQALAIKVPQLLHTLVTGSTLGLYAGSANAAGSAIASAGSSAYAAAFARPPGGGGGGAGAPSGSSGGSMGHRAESVMDAVQRSAFAAGGMADPFHVHSGADPFGARRAPDPLRGGRGGSVFGHANVRAAPPTPIVEFSGDGTPVSEASASGVRDARPSGGSDRQAANEMPMGTPGASVVAGPKGAHVMGTQSVGSIDTAVEAGTAAWDITNSTRDERRSVSTSGRHDASGQAVADLRARTRSASAPSIEPHLDTSTAPHAADSLVGRNVPPEVEEATTRRDSSLSEAPPGPVPYAGTSPAADGHAETIVNISDVRHATSPAMSNMVNDTTVRAAGSAALATQERHATVPPAPLPGTGSGDMQTTVRDVRDRDIAPSAARKASAHVPDLRTATDVAVARTPMAAGEVAPPAIGPADLPPSPGPADGNESPTTADSSRRPSHAPTISVAQEDMKAAPPMEEAQVLIPGATVEAPLPPDTHVAPEAADASSERSPGGRKKSRVRRRPDEASSTMPPVESDEPSEEDKP